MSNETEPRIIETPTPEQTHDSFNPNRKRSVIEKLDTRGKRFGAAVAGLGLFLGAGYGVSQAIGGDRDNTPETTPTPSAEAPASPSATPVETTPATTEPSPSDLPTEIAPTPSEGLEAYANNLEREQLFELFSISAEEYTTPEAISDRYTELQGLWMNTGGAVHFDWDLITNEEDSIDDIMTTFDGPITERLFTDSADAQAFITMTQDEIRQYAVRNAYWAVASDNEGDYSVKYDLTDSVLTSGSIESGQFTVTNTVRTTDNGGASIAEFRKIYDINLWQDVTRTESVRFIEENGTWKVDGSTTLTKENNSHN